MFFEQWNNLLERAPVLLLRWETNPERTIIATAGIGGFNPEANFQTGNSYIQRIHPEDRAHSIEQLAKNGMSQLSYRLNNTDNTVCCVTEYSQIASNNKNEREGLLIVQQTTEPVRTLKLRLDRCEQELQDFAYIASHDMKEPLRKIQAFGDRLQNKFAAELGEQGQDYLIRMLNATVRLQNFLDGLLEFSRVTTRSAELQRCDLGKVFNQQIALLQQEIDRLQASVAVPPLPVVTVDNKQIHQLVHHLLDNALKFHIKNVTPIISVSVKQVQSHLWISIKDNGIGFKQEDEHKVFRMFQRLHGRSQYPGAGIGLSVCRKIIERHGGEIYAESSPDSGTIFNFSLPINSSTDGE